MKYPRDRYLLGNAVIVREEQFFEWVHRTTAARYNAEQQGDAAVCDIDQEAEGQVSQPLDADAPAAARSSHNDWNESKTASAQ